MVVFVQFRETVTTAHAQLVIPEQTVKKRPVRRNLAKMEELVTLTDPLTTATVLQDFLELTAKTLPVHQSRA